MTNKPRYTIRIYMGAKDKYIALSLWEPYVDSNGNFRPANVSMIIHNEGVEAKASMRTGTAARLVAVLLSMVAEAEKLTMKERKKFAIEEGLEEKFLLEEKEEKVLEEVNEIKLEIE